MCVLPYHNTFHIFRIVVKPYYDDILLLGTTDQQFDFRITSRQHSKITEVDVKKI
jgi:hypothetical protein